MFFIIARILGGFLGVDVSTREGGKQISEGLKVNYMYTLTIEC